jgi:hypothetical protein
MSDPAETARVFSLPGTSGNTASTQPPPEPDDQQYEPISPVTARSSERRALSGGSGADGGSWFPPCAAAPHPGKTIDPRKQDATASTRKRRLMRTYYAMHPTSYKKRSRDFALRGFSDVGYSLT